MVHPDIFLSGSWPLLILCLLPGIPFSTSNIRMLKSSSYVKAEVTSSVNPSQTSPPLHPGSGHLLHPPEHSVHIPSHFSYLCNCLVSRRYSSPKGKALLTPVKPGFEFMRSDSCQFIIFWHKRVTVLVVTVASVLGGSVCSSLFIHPFISSLSHMRHVGCMLSLLDT